MPPARSSRCRRLVSGQDGGRVGHAGLTHQHGLGLSPHRLHRRGMRAVGQQRHLHQAAAHLDRLHQAGGDDIPPGGRIFDRAQCGTQAIGAVSSLIFLQTSLRRADKQRRRVRLSDSIWRMRDVPPTPVAAGDHTGPVRYALE